MVVASLDNMLAGMIRMAIQHLDKDVHHTIFNSVPIIKD
jgi:hypothetical protein